MADDALRPTLDAFPETAYGAYARPTPVEPTRSWGDALKDTALELGAGAVRTYGRGFGGAADAVGGAISTTPPTEHPKMDALSDIEKYLLDQRSPNAKYVDERGGPSFWREPGRYAAHTATGIVPYLPFAALGPWGAVPAGVAAYGTEQAEDLEMARSGDMSNNSQYLSMLQSGMSDKEARTKIAQDLIDPTNPDTYLRRAPATVGNMIGMGLGAAVTMKAARGISDKMVDRIVARTTGGGAMRATGIGVAEGVGAGAALGAGTDWSRQQAEIAAGQRQGTDWMQTGEATLEPMGLFGTLTGAGKGVRRVRELSAKRAADAAAAKAAEDAKAGEIGTDILDTARKEAELDQPMYEPPSAEEQYDRVPTNRPPSPHEQYDIQPLDRPPAPHEQYDIRETTRPPEPHEQYDTFRPEDRPPTPNEQYDRPVYDHPPAPPEVPPSPWPSHPAQRRSDIGPRTVPEDRPAPVWPDQPAKTRDDMRAGTGPHPPQETRAEWLRRHLEQETDPDRLQWLEEQLTQEEGRPAPVWPDQPARRRDDMQPRTVPENRPETPWPDQPARRRDDMQPRTPPPDGQPPRGKGGGGGGPRGGGGGPREGGGGKGELVEFGDHEEPPVAPPKRGGKGGDEGGGELVEHAPYEQPVISPKKAAADKATARRAHLQTLKDGLDKPDLDKFNEKMRRILDKGASKITKASFTKAVKDLFDKEVLNAEERKAIADAFHNHARETVDFMEKGEEGEKVAKSKSQEESRAEEGATAKSGDGNATQASSKKEGGAAVVQKVRDKAKAKVEAETETEAKAPVAASAAADTTTETKAGPKGKAVIRTFKELGEKLRGVLTSKLKTLPDNLTPAEREAADRLSAKMAANPDADINTLAREAAEEQAAAEKLKPENFIANAVEKNKAKKAKKTASNYKANEKRVRTLVLERETSIKTALKDMTDTLSKIAHGNRTAKEEFDDLFAVKQGRLKDIDPNAKPGENAITLDDLPIEGLSNLLTTMLNHAEERIQQAMLQMHQRHMEGGPGVDQISWTIARKRGAPVDPNPWYGALFDLDKMKRDMISLLVKNVPDKSVFDTEISKEGDVRPARKVTPEDIVLDRKSAGLAKYLMTEMYILDRAIEDDKIHLWDRWHKEKYDREWNEVMDNREYLINEVIRLTNMRNLIQKVEAQTSDTAKATLTDAERSAYAAAKNTKTGYTARKLQNRIRERDKSEELVHTLLNTSGIDPYTKGELGSADYLNRRQKEAEQFILDFNLSEADKAVIQEARRNDKIDMRERLTLQTKIAPDDRVGVGAPRAEARRTELGTETAPPRKGQSEAKPAPRDAAGERTQEEKATKRVLEIVDEIEQINEALEAVPFGERLREVLGSKEQDPAKLSREADARMKALEDEQRDNATRADPKMLGDDYSFGKILDKSAPLRTADGKPIRGNLPAGAWVKTVSEFLKPGKSIFGRETSVRQTGTTREALLSNHVFDVADKVVGHTEVVGLTPEQMMLVAVERGLKPDTPSFYDPQAGRIFIRHDVGATDSPEFRRVLGHEIVHPLSEVALEHFPDIRNRIDAVRKLLIDKMVPDTAASRHPASGIMEGRGHALKNVHEFLSEFFNDGGTLMRALDTVTPTAAERKSIGVGTTLLGKMIKALGEGLRRLFLRGTRNTLLADAMVHSLDLFKKIEELHGSKERGEMKGRPLPVYGTEARPITADWNTPKDPKDKFYKDTQNWVERGASKMAHAWSRFDGKTGFALWAHDLSQQTRRFEPGMQAVTKGVQRALAHSYTSATRIMDEAHVTKIANQIARAMESNPKAWEHYLDYYDFENQASVSGKDAIGKGRNAWIHPTSEEHQQFRDYHAELSAAYKTMPKPFKELHEALRQAYDARHEELAQASLEQLIDLNQMATNPVTRDNLIRFIRDKDNVTPEQRADLEAHVPGFKWDLDRKDKSPEYAKFKERMGELRGLSHLRKIPGVWFPKFRKGDWVTEGVFDTSKHAKKHGGIELLNEDGEAVRGTWDFTTEAQRKAFMADMRADPILKQVKFSGMKEMEAEDGTKFYRAAYNTLMLDFHKTQLDAANFHGVLKERFKDNIVLTHPEPRRIEDTTYLNPIKADRALNSMMGSLHKSEGWADLDRSSQARLERSMNEGAARYIMGASARATYLPRRYALGSRKDVMQDFLEYFTNTSYSLAELRNRNELKASYKALDTYTDDMKTSGEHEKYHIGRRQLQASLHRRADYRPDPILSPLWKKGLARTLQLSYLDKLVSPMNWVLNGTELWMTGAPMLAGVHGARAYGAIMKAMSDIGYTKYMDGFKDAATVYKAGIGGVPEMADVPKRFKEMTKDLKDAKEIHALIDYLEEYAHLDRDSSMEVGRIFDPTANKFMRGIDWGDNITRQISANIDNVNRIVLGIAAMRLSAEGKGSIAGLEGRLAHAEKYIGKMAGNYAKYNEAEMFRHPALGPMLQFKRYAQRMTANWIGVVHNSFFKDVAPEDRAVARRQLMYMMGTVMFVSGALGLPWEPIKGVINAFSPLTGYNSDDVENLARQGAAAALGKDLGYAFTRGVPRAYFNMGIGTRLGLDSMWTQGAPGNRPDSWYASIGHFVLGAPGSYGVEAIEGVGRLAKAAGNFARGNTSEGWNNLRHGAQLVVPVKAFADSLDSAVTYLGGPETRTRFGQPLGYQPTALEAAMQVGGMRSGRSQERGDLRRQISRDTTKRQAAATEAYSRYIYAEGAEKAAVRSEALAAFNREWPDYPLKVADFVRADARHKKEISEMASHPERAGLSLSRKQQNMLPRYEGYVM